VIALFVLVTVAKSVRTVPQQRMDVVERLGKYKRTLSPGLNLLVPFVDAVRTKVDMREQVVAFPPQPVITSDNLVVSIDTVLYFKVVDPVRATYEIANFLQAIEQLTVTTLRNVIGSLDLERALTSREEINRHLSERARRDHRPVGHQGDPGGDQGDRAAAEHPRLDGEADARRAGAPRHDPQRRGHKQAQILTAEGEKQAAVLRADGDRQARILQAEGQAKAIRTVFDAIHTPTRPEGAGVPVPAGAAADRERPANKVWIVPTELTRALEGLGGALGGLANMVGDVPTAAVDAGAVEREAVAVAEAAAAEAAEGRRRGPGGRGAGVRRSGQAALPAPEPVPPSAALGGADYNGAARSNAPDRA
jgi:regulator of protease activity HflC (stomatin/prohibitin superfamily)